MEDTQTTRRELDESFGAEVAAIVAEVTDDKTLTKATRKERQIQHAAHLSDGAKLVKLADKISNVRDVASSPPADWPLERRREYFEWAKRVVDGLGAVNGPLQAEFARQYQQRP
jgi:guanosine-3',5'-bis(diphosphate) 3'-pyrophosphohydrolase